MIRNIIGNRGANLLVRTCANIKRRIGISTFNVVTITVATPITYYLNNIGVHPYVSSLFGLGVGAVVGTVATDLVVFLGNGVQTAVEVNLVTPTPEANPTPATPVQRPAQLTQLAQLTPGVPSAQPIRFTRQQPAITHQHPAPAKVPAPGQRRMIGRIK